MSTEAQSTPTPTTTAEAPTKLPTTTRTLGVEVMSREAPPAAIFDVGHKPGTPVEKITAAEAAEAEHVEPVKTTATSTETHAKVAKSEEKAQEAPKEDAKATADDKADDKADGDTPPIEGYAAYEAEWQANGSLSEETYAKLADQGFPKDVVDDFIAYRQERAERLTAQWTEMMGGPDQQKVIMDWARENYSEKQRAAYNRAMDSGDPDIIELAIKGVVADYRAKGGTFEAKARVGEEAPAAPAVEGFASQADYRKEVRSLRYKHDPAYRRDVEARLKASSWVRG